MKCKVCDMLQARKGMIYEDDKVAAFLSEHPATIGHIILAPKEHFPIFENVPDFLVSHMFMVANKLSTACFDAIGAQGTNILVNNGIEAGQADPHFIINIVPRREEDGINLQWEPRQVSEEELSRLELQIKEQSEAVGDFEKEKSAPVNMDKDTEKIEEDEDNYLLKSLDRIP